MNIKYTTWEKLEYDLGLFFIKGFSFEFIKRLFNLISSRLSLALLDCWEIHWNLIFFEFFFDKFLKLQCDCNVGVF